MIDLRGCNPQCSKDDLNPLLLRLLEQLSEVVGTLEINSAYRSVEYEKSKGRSGRSSHCQGLAVDIRVFNSSHRYKLLRTIFERKLFNRIGIYSTFIHVDIDLTKPENVIWYEKD